MSSTQQAGSSDTELDAVFFAAIAVEEIPARRALLDQLCGDDVKRRQFLLSLLEMHESIVRDIPQHHATEDGQSGDDPPRKTHGIPLDLLSPSRHPGSVGRLGCYEIIQVVDLGGMSVVVEAFDTYLNRIVAIKILAPTLCRHRQARERFQREAQAAAAIDHQHVTKIFTVDQQNNTPYLVMEFIQGRTLASRLQEEGRLPHGELLRIGGQIAEGLTAMHDKGLLHRDLKPDNVLLEAPQDTVKISDFGVARAIDDRGLTRTGEINGTPQFMSPEQAQGRAVDQRSDLFSFGALLYAMAVGRSAFEAATPLASMKRVCDETPPPISQFRRDLPPWLTEVICQLLAKNPENRLLTTRQLAELFASDGLPRRAASPGKPRNRFARILRALVVATVCLVILVGGVLFEVGRMTDPSQSMMTRLDMYVNAYALVTVEVDDPQVQFFLQKTGANPVHKVGAFNAWLYPGPWTLRVFKDGREVGSQQVSLPPWSRKTLVVETSLQGDESTDGVPMRITSSD